MGRRANICDAAPAERADLAAAILQYATPDVVRWHREHHELHQSGIAFLDGHRGYLAGLEAFLRSVGRLGPNELLPAWDPSDSNPRRRLIPAEFIVPARGEGRIHDVWAPLRPLVAWSFFPFKGRWRRLWRSKRVFGFSLCWGPHFAVHVLVGGIFGQIPRTPETPLFWIWHAYIDDLYWDWQEVHPDAARDRDDSPHVHGGHP